jgi:hypothetical protein
MAQGSRIKMADRIVYLVLAVHSVQFVHSDPAVDGGSSDDGPVIKAIDLQVTLYRKNIL